MAGLYLRRSVQGVKIVTAEEQPGGARRAKQTVLCPGTPDEQQKVALWIIRRMLVQFHREWTGLRERESSGAWVSVANALLDRYSHQLYDVICDVEAVISDDLAVDIRCLSADMIKTANILIMIDCKEECCRRGDALAKEALRHAKRCVPLQRSAHPR